MTEDERLIELETIVRGLACPTDHSHQLADLEIKVAGLAKQIASLPAPPPLGMTKADVIHIVNAAVIKSPGLGLTAIGTAVGVKMKEAAKDVDAKIGGIQASAAQARSAARASVESAVITLEHASYSLKANQPAIKAANECDKVFKTLEATIASARAVDPPPRDATPGQLLTLMKTPAPKEISMVADVALYDANKAVDRINDQLNVAAERGVELSKLAGFLSGSESLSDNAPESLKTAAIILKTASASGFPVSAVAEKLSSAAVEYLSAIRQYQGELIPRQRGALGVAAAAQTAEAYARASKLSLDIRTRQGLREKGFVFRDIAESLRQNHRRNFPRSR